jgi:hypothetical protein
MISLDRTGFTIRDSLPIPASIARHRINQTFLIVVVPDGGRCLQPRAVPATTRIGIGGCSGVPKTTIRESLFRIVM